MTNIRRARKEGSLPSYPDLSSMKLKRSGYQNRHACERTLPRGLALHKIKWQDGKLKDNRDLVSLALRCLTRQELTAAWETNRELAEDKNDVPRCAFSMAR